MPEHPHNQPGDTAMNREITAITDPLLRMPSSASPEALIMATLEHTLREAGPRQAEVLRRCAIPRWFDLDVLAVLRGTTQGNERILDAIADYSFVRQIDATRYTYHDTVREALLNEWETRRPDDLRQLDNELAAHFARRARDAAPAQPKHLPFMTLTVAPTGEWELCEREALYHLLRANPAAGLAQLRDMYARAESTHQLGDAEALLKLASSVHLPPEGQYLLRYLRARTERAALRLDTARTRLELLHTEETLPDYLRAEVAQTLGEVYAEVGLWARAIEHYEDSLQRYRTEGRSYEVAQVQLRIGEAYQDIALNMGGWHVPALTQHPVGRLIGQFWLWLLSLPFYVVVFFLRKTPWPLPRPRFLSSYMNWMLARTWLTARGWFEQSRAAFAAQGDESGTLHADQRMIQIMLRFGYHAEALAGFDELLRRPAASDPYIRAWIERDRGGALLRMGRYDEARQALDRALAHFRTVGDIRRESSVVAQQSQLAVQEGRNDDALIGYRSSLERYRTLDYTAAREQVLYDLRAWRRRLGTQAPAAAIDTMLAEEPEKRYVARFPRSQIRWLQAILLSAVPLTLFLLALVQSAAPALRLNIVDSLALRTATIDPVRAVVVLVLVAMLFSVAYTLVGLAVMYLIPFNTLRREQPDYLITSPDGITRYDYRGDIAQQIGWGRVRRWVRGDRKLWSHPQLLFSSSELQGEQGEGVFIDGITAWYTPLQEDIGLHLRSVGNPVTPTDMGYTILKSKMGASFILGSFLLLLMATGQNGWIPGVWLLGLPAQVYASLALFSFSGILLLAPLAYWFAARPMQALRSSNTRSIWPAITIGTGIAATLFGLLSQNGLLTRLPGLDLGLTIWGIYVAAQGFATLFRLRTRTLLPLGLAALAILAGLPRAHISYLSMVSNTATRQAVAYSAQDDRSGAINAADTAIAAQQEYINQDAGTLRDQARVQLERGASLYSKGDYTGAASAFGAAANLYQQVPDSIQWQADALYNRALSYREQGDDAAWRQGRAEACSLYGVQIDDVENNEDQSQQVQATGDLPIYCQEWLKKR